MARTLILLPEKHKLCIGGKNKTAYIILVNKSVKDETIEKKLPSFVRNATLAELYAFKDITLKTEKPIVALGGYGPAPYQGRPSLMPGGEIVSVGIYHHALPWSKGTRLLVIKK